VGQAVWPATRTAGAIFSHLLSHNHSKDEAQSAWAPAMVDVRDFSTKEGHEIPPGDHSVAANVTIN